MLDERAGNSYYRDFSESAKHLKNRLVLYPLAFIRCFKPFCSYGPVNDIHNAPDIIKIPFF
jgi:hypothetical protein